MLGVTKPTPQPVSSGRRQRERMRRPRDRRKRRIGNSPGGKTYDRKGGGRRVIVRRVVGFGGVAGRNSEAANSNSK
jgi:hypothetical protein